MGQLSKVVKGLYFTFVSISVPATGKVRSRKTGEMKKERERIRGQYLRLTVYFVVHHPVPHFQLGHLDPFL